MQTITPQQLVEKQQSGEVDLIDVRTPVEFREVHANGARNIPLDSLDPQAVVQSRNGNADEPLYIICRSGQRGQSGSEVC